MSDSCSRAFSYEFAVSELRTGGSVMTAVSAVVSYDGATGLVALVLTYGTSRPVQAPRVVQGDEVTYQGSITSLVNAQGVNLAPNGASSVTINSKTGKLVRYYMSRETRSAENEIEAWDYHPTTESIREVPECQGTSVTVFND